MKKILCFVLALLFFVTLLPNTSVTASDVTITAEINGKPLAFTDAVPYEDNGVLMVPSWCPFLKSSINQSWAGVVVPITESVSPITSNIPA
jgi:hypothetical protein